MEMTLGYVLDGALMILLGVAIWYGIRLNRQIAAIREGRKELEGLIKDFTGATDRAEGALADLKAEVGETLSQARLSARQAAELCDDLEFLIKRGGKVADGLERAVRGGQAVLPRDFGEEDPVPATARGAKYATPPAAPTSRQAASPARPQGRDSESAESLLKDALAAARQEAPPPASASPAPPALSVDPRDRPGSPPPHQGQTDRATAASEDAPASVGERGKSKTDLLKALRDMR